MTTATLLALVAERGLSVCWGTGGDLRLKGPKGQMTPALVRVLKLHRDAVAATMPPPPVAQPAPEPATPTTGRRFALIGKTGRVLLWPESQPVPEGATYTCTEGDAAWTAAGTAGGSDE